MQNKFSDSVKMLRESQNLSQEQFGKLIGLSKQTINDIEKGRSKTTLDRAAKIADYFGVSIDYLMGRTDSPTPVLRAASGLTEDTDMEAVEGVFDMLDKLVEEKKNKDKNK